MAVELRPLGVACNLACTYCYQDPQREAGNTRARYDLELMKKAALKEGQPFALFGGEPLLLPLADLEELLRFGLEQFGRNALQTNGTLISSAHLKLFRKYQVQVGLSLDGPGELNALRISARAGNTAELTQKSEQAIRDLLREDISVALIVTLHRQNASAEKLPQLGAWLQELQALGVRKARLHLLESETPLIRKKFGLSDEENIAALRYLKSLGRSFAYEFLDTFTEMEALLSGDDRRATCVWKNCDPYTTAAVRGVEGNGKRTNCGRTNKDGIDFHKASNVGFERNLALMLTPQEHGGCRDCKFFLVCRGQCPGTAQNGDWRNRTEHCEVWKGIFQDLEDEMLVAGQIPVSLHPDRKQWEKDFFQALTQGKSPELWELVTKKEPLHAKA